MSKEGTTKGGPLSPSLSDIISINLAKGHERTSFHLFFTPMAP